MLRVSIGDDAAWLLQMLRVGVQESLAQGPGARSLLAKLAELMFVEAIRRFAATQPEDQRGWLAGLRDRHVGRALALLHGSPAHSWTVDSLAREVAMSRSAFAERFVELIGEPPMRVPHALAARARGAASANRQRHGRARRGARGLRVRGRVQSRVQTRVRHAAVGVAQERARYRPRAGFGRVVSDAG